MAQKEISMKLILLMTLCLLEDANALGGGCILGENDLGHEYSALATAKRYQEQIHLGSGPVQGLHFALAEDKQMIITWLNPTVFKPNIIFTPECKFGPLKDNLTEKSLGQSYTYPEGMFKYTLNKAIIDCKIFSSMIIYFQCGDNKFGFSPVYNLTIQSTFVDSSLLFESELKKGLFDASKPVVAVIGDHGVKSGEATATNIADHVKNDNVQLIVHAGDISYADKYGGSLHNNSYIWVSYMNLMQQATAFVPYMTTVGNHEHQFNFSAYLNWLGNSMPYKISGSSSPFWYSFDYMGIHFVAFSTEHDFSQNSTQHQWMEKDLLLANKNRRNVPWIVVFGHRPLYCTSIICFERCEKDAPVFRDYLEDLLYQQKVDVVFSGHNHQYERSYPVYKLKAVQRDYKNPKAPVYIVNGAAGNPELNDPTFRPSVEWRAFDDPTFETGYILMQPTQTELRFQYMNSDKKKIVDQFVITKS